MLDQLGPVELARIEGMKTRETVKKIYDASSGSEQDRRSRRQAQNRKSSQSLLKSREAETRALEDINASVRTKYVALQQVGRSLEREKEALHGLMQGVAMVRKHANEN